MHQAKGGSYQKPFMRQGRHRCNGCSTIFDCTPCYHEHAPAVFCSEACELQQQKKIAEEVRNSSVFDSYLSRAGLSAAPAMHRAGGGAEAVPRAA